MTETSDAIAIFAPLWKRKWLILAVGILVAGATYVYYKRQPTTFAVSTQLYLASGTEQQAAIAGGGKGGTIGAKTLADQAALINSPVIGEAAHALLRKEHGARAVGKVSAKTSTTTDFITVTAEAASPKAAVKLANAYAKAYVARQYDNYQRTIRTAIANTRKQLSRIEAGASASNGGGGRTTTTTKGKGKHGGTTTTTSGGRSTASSSGVIQEANLANKINQLEAQLQIKGVQQLSPAKLSTATLTSASPKRNAIFGFVLGVLLSSIAVYIVSRFDRRLRTLAEIEGVFQSQILTALPRVRRPILSREGAPSPSAALVEPLWRLQTGLQVSTLHGQRAAEHPRSLLFVSADPGDGRSTIVAALALVQRDAAKRVAVVEADMRRPVQARLLGATEERGLGEVLAGQLQVGSALQRVGTAASATPASPADGGDGGVTTVVGPLEERSVSLLVAGKGVGAPGALLGSGRVLALLRSLAEESDQTLVDAPSPLEFADVIPLLDAVDGIVIVARAGHTREVSARRLIELLARVPSAPVLGVVANHVAAGDIAKYGFSAGKTGLRGRLKPIRR